MQHHLSAWSVSGRERDGNALRLEEVLLGPAKAGVKNRRNLWLFPTRMVGFLWGCEPLTKQFVDPIYEFV